MFSRSTSALFVAAVVALTLAVPYGAPANAAPSSAQTSASRATATRASQEYEAAQTRFLQAQASAAQASASLDRAVQAESEARDELGKVVLTAYRSDNDGFLSVLLDATSFEEFITRWDVLTRIARQDVETLEALQTARIEAQGAARKLLDLQTAQERSLDGLAEKVAAARKELAANETALREFNARAAASAKRTPAKQPPRVTGSGAWKTAVASHYGRNFTGRGASGEAIGPYSMMVAHKTLPFGTLIEFEYNGKRAVAKVADRGPYTKGRTFDLGPGVVRVLDFSGVHEVRYRIIGK
ncbi:MAG: RlpA-like double-psi beta-barrel domain-containing protein [Actinomycetota bacterium]|nr:MAG: rare lipoprotein [Actinomycetota bacterium]MDO8950396.1 RlpA-like double-psi beta-barrel domain-containing protein [Actinomycetota bacterium]MDP3630391.1 RlpA-like double-psi beta-barrel domain-containing protein [Actinomycetota bacterium]